MRTKLIIAETELAQWHELVKQAEADYGCTLDESLQSYLVFTLMRFMKNRQLNSRALALDYLRGQRLTTSLRHDQLRDVGDQCLLVSGLYPKRAARRQLRVSYYVDLGRSAYHHLSDCAQQGVAELYHQLEEAFVMLMDVLQTIRQYNSPALARIEAIELWSDTGSPLAFRQLSDGALPLHEGLLDLDQQH